MGIRVAQGETSEARPRRFGLQVLGVVCAVTSVLFMAVFWTFQFSEAEEWNTEEAIAIVMDSVSPEAEVDTSVFRAANWRQVLKSGPKATSLGPRYVLPLTDLQDIERRRVMENLQGISVGLKQDGLAPQGTPASRGNNGLPGDTAPTAGGSE